ncbi:MAG: hypothetical protein AMJ89_02945 [candidate division Zixibacteria bacterium SM23_73]|nr:MAG: hypothetical protein AMJ89_02945 [candidate division Zixibacteria bacterium SM23_73]
MNPYPIGLIQALSIAISLILLAYIVYLIRKKKLKEEYAILWIAIIFVFLIFAIFRGLIDYISNLLGIYYQPASLFIILIVGLFLLVLHFSIVISDLKTKINKLVITLTLLEEEMSKLKKLPLQLNE